MKKSEARLLVPQLLSSWRSECFPSTAEQDLDASEFLGWLRRHHRNVLSFRSTMGAEFDVEQWFAAECRQGWKY